MIWIGILIGIVVMQLSMLIMCWAFKENEEIVLPFSVFLFFPLVLLINKICYMCREKKRQKALKKRNKEKDNEINND